MRSGPSQQIVKLSIVIPAFNEAKTISRVLDRIKECVGDFHEIIVVDDASTDGTADQVRERAESYTRVRLLRLKRNSGMTAALLSAYSTFPYALVFNPD